MFCRIACFMFLFSSPAWAASSGTRGGVPPRLPSIAQASGDYGIYHLSFDQIVPDFAQLQIDDGVGGPSQSLVDLKRAGDRWLNEGAASDADAKIVIVVDSASRRLQVLRWDADYFSPLTAVSCGCSAEGEMDGWNIHRTNAYADGSTRTWLMGRYFDQKDCEATFLTDFPVCNQTIRSDLDIVRLRAAADQKASLASWRTMASCSDQANKASIVKFGDETFGVLFQTAADPQGQMRRFHCAAGSLRNWDLSCEAESGDFLKLTWIEGSKVARWSLSGGAAACNDPMDKDPRFGVSWEPYVFVQGYGPEGSDLNPSYVRPQSQTLTVSYYDPQGNGLNISNVSLYLDGSASIELLGQGNPSGRSDLGRFDKEVAIRFTNGGVVDAVIQHAVPEPLIRLNAGRSMPLRNLSAIYGKSDGSAGLEMRLYDSERAWHWEDLAGSPD